VHVELIYVLPVHQLVKLVFILHVQIVIPPDIFKQHLPKIFFQPKIGKMEIDETHNWIKVQNLYIARWIVIEKEQLTNINLGSEKKNLQQVKISVDIKLVSFQVIQLLKEFKDIFAWTYKDM
jgi:hypothetical protein